MFFYLCFGLRHLHYHIIDQISVSSTTIFTNWSTNLLSGGLSMCSPNFRLIRKLINPNRKVRKAKTTLQILKHSVVTSDLWVFSLKALFTIQNLITLQPFKNQGDHMSLFMWDCTAFLFLVPHLKTVSHFFTGSAGRALF